MLALDSIIREKINGVAENYTNLAATLKQHADAWFHANQQTLPARKTLALFYEHFRIEESAANSMALTLFRTLRYSQYGDKNLLGFWEAWREMVRRLGTLVGLKALAESLYREIADAKILHDEMKDFKKLISVNGINAQHYDILCNIITNKIADVDHDTRTKEQLAAHDKHVQSLQVRPPRDKGGKSGKKGKGKGKTGGLHAADGAVGGAQEWPKDWQPEWPKEKPVLTEAQTEAHAAHAAKVNRDWQLQENEKWRIANGWYETPGPKAGARTRTRTPQGVGGGAGGTAGGTGGAHPDPKSPPVDPKSKAPPKQPMLTPEQHKVWQYHTDQLRALGYTPYTPEGKAGPKHPPGKGGGKQKDDPASK